MSDDSKELMSRVELGIETEAFLNGPIGRYLVAALERQSKRASESLRTVNPADMAEIIKLQFEWRQAGKINGTLRSLIEDGWQAETELKTKEL